MDRRAATGALVFVLTLAFLAPLVHDSVFGAGNDASRFAQIEAIVDQGRTSIEASRYRWTIDRTSIGGHDYSNKPPLLSLAGAGLYAVLKRSTGLGFETDEAAVVYLLTLWLAAVPTAALVARFHAALRSAWGDRTASPSLLTVSVAAATILTSFSTTLNNHTVAAALLFAACAAAWSAGPLSAGALTALVICVDIVPGVVFAPAIAVMAYERAGVRGLRRCGAAIACSIPLFAAADLYVLGSPWPAKMVPGAIDYSSSAGPSVAGVLLPNEWTYPISALFGWHGFFTVSPVLLFGAFGMVRSLRVDRPLPRRSTLALAAATAVLIAGHALLVGSYGGWSYGFRYLIPVVPILLFYAPAALGPLGRRLFPPVLALSCLTAILGAYNPWPPVDEPGTGKHPVASLVTNPIGGNLAAWMQEYVPGSAPTDAALRLFVSEDAGERSRYLRVFYASKGDLAAMRRIPLIPESTP